MTKEVFFNKYCYRCIHRATNEADLPCDDCLAIGGREDSHKPEYFKLDPNWKPPRVEEASR